MTRTNTFTKGSGCYTCCCCGRLTRDDGNKDSVNLRQCGFCYTLGGLENQIEDEGPTPALIAEVESIKKQIVAHGGTI